MPVKSAEAYLENHDYWQAELESLRDMLLETELSETIKWGVPVYTLNGKNVVGIAAFKNHISLWFYQGALLRKNTALLQNAQEGKTKALRQIRFEKGDTVLPIGLLHNYVMEAIQNQKEGKEITPERDKDVEIPRELKRHLQTDSALNKAFKGLTPGRQKEYCQHITEAKKESTKATRIEKIKPLIFAGIGLHDKYRK